MKRQLYQHVEWLENGLDGMPLSETFIWIFVDLNPDLNVYRLTSDLQILKVMFLLAQVLSRLLLRSPLMSISRQIYELQNFTEEEVRDGCIELRAYDLAFNSQPRKLAFCITYNLLYYYEHDVIKLYMLLSDDVNDLHYNAA